MRPEEVGVFISASEEQLTPPLNGRSPFGSPIEITIQALCQEALVVAPKRFSGRSLTI